MNRKQASTNVTSDVLARMMPWRQALFERILRMVAIIALPMLLVGGYYVYTTGQTWLLGLILFGYVGVVVSAFMSRIPYVWRVWALLCAMLILGVSDLLSYGWGEDGRIYLMAATLFATLFLGGRHSVAVLIVSSLLLTLFVVLVSLGVVVPMQQGVEYTTTALVSESLRASSLAEAGPPRVDTLTLAAPASSLKSHSNTAKKSSSLLLKY